MNATANSGGLNESRASQKEVSLQLLPCAKFYATLVRLKVRKSDKNVPNLKHFLKLNDEMPDMILVKKLLRVIEEFLRSHYLKAFGFSKMKLTPALFVEQPVVQEVTQDEDYGEEYYDEEEPHDEAA